MQAFRLTGQNTESSDLPNSAVHSDDDRNWQILRARWTDLRTELHGNLLPKALQQHRDLQGLNGGVTRATPHFLPLRANE